MTTSNGVGAGKRGGSRNWMTGTGAKGAFVVSILTLAAGSSAPVIAQTHTQPESTQPHIAAAATPSTLDYVVLASLADASSLLSLTAYRSPATATAEVRCPAAAATAPQPGE